MQWGCCRVAYRYSQNLVKITNTTIEFDVALCANTILGLIKNILTKPVFNCIMHWNYASFLEPNIFNKKSNFYYSLGLLIGDLPKCKAPLLVGACPYHIMHIVPNKFFFNVWCKIRYILFWTCTSAIAYSNHDSQFF